MEVQHFAFKMDVKMKPEVTTFFTTKPIETATKGNLESKTKNKHIAPVDSEA